MKKIILILISISLSLNMIGCAKTDIAQINEVSITKEQYEQTKEILDLVGYENEMKEDKRYNNDIDKDILAFIIDNEVVYQQSKKKNIKIEDKEIKEQLKKFKDTINDNEEKSKVEFTKEQEELLENQIKKDLVVSKYKEDFIKDINIKDEEIESYYKNNEDEFNIEKVKASQILVSGKSEKSKKKAQKILDRINKKENFDKLAKEFSDDKSSGQYGGDLGYFSKDEKNIKFTKEVFELEKNKVSDIIETPYGYHIVKLTDKKRFMRTLDESREDIKNKILNKRYLQHVDSLYKQGEITITM